VEAKWGHYSNPGQNGERNREHSMPRLEAMKDKCVMRGGSRSELSKCSDGRFYVVKLMVNQ
jgi:hypothetical protein